LVHTPFPSSSTTAWERLFLECDKQGRVLWMNRRARARLGPVESLLEALPAPHLRHASELLRSGGVGIHQTLLSSLQCADRPVRIQVQLVRLLSLEDRVVLSAEVRARASDNLPPQSEVLSTLLKMQGNATRNYFRLVRAHETLVNRIGRRKPAGVAVSEALEMERTRIARELHSGAGQSLAGIKLNLELVADRLPDAPEVVVKSLARIADLADQALSEIRFVSQRLHPPDWQRLDLPRAIEWLWETSGIPERFHAKLELRPVESDLPDAVRFTAYRAAQEGIANLLRHSGASEVRLELGQSGDHLHLVLEDNGTGFDAGAMRNGAPAAQMRGIGLRAMRDEVEGLGGNFDLTSGAAGTRMEITLPISENR